ncbi:MAG: tetratricopeptide repeat-containing sulfotransferase family protein [Fimbriimonadaceae bacterium]
MAANQAYREGRLEDAARLAREWLAASPNNLDAMLLIGISSARLERADDAVEMLTAVAQKAPNVYLVYYWLASALRRRNELPEAVKMAQKAVTLSPNEAQGYHQLGLCYLEMQNWEQAEIHLRRAANLAPRVSGIHASLGCALEELGRAAEARLAYKRAVALDPRNINALSQLGLMHIHQLDYEGAAEYAERILSADPDATRGHALLAAVLVGMDRPAEARAHADRVLAKEPDKADSFTLYGTTLQAIGQMDEAERYFRRSIETERLQGYPYYGIVRARKLSEADRELVDQMEEAISDPRLPRVFRRDLEYALGKACTDLGDPGLAMAHYDAGNALLREMRFGVADFDAEHFRAGVDFVIQNFDARFIEAYRAHGSPDPLPIWVVGMMRSGTTLAEQILSCHPAIAGSGERRFWMEHRRDALLPPGNVIDAAKLEQVCASYLELLRGFGPEAERVIDKLPTNYGHLGLLHVAFPNARIIHMRRHPVDTCLSIWTTLNSASVEWSCVKKNIVFVYKEYLRVMEHWRRVLPPGVMLEVDYSDLVTEPNTTIRAMIAHCGMDWNERCLRPQDNQRAIATPSDWQVRQPIYRSSIERWRPFEPYLGEFAELLDTDLR